MIEIGSFEWKRGSINDSISKILSQKGIEYVNTFNGHIEVDLYGIGLWQRVQYALTNPVNEAYVVYVD